MHVRERSLQAYAEMLLRYGVLTIAALIYAVGIEAQAIQHYSPGGWPTLHQDAGNRRSTNISVQHQQYAYWSVLPGASVLTAPVASPDGKTFYATSGLSSGQSNLHAISTNGQIQWQSAAWTNPDHGVDPCAILSSPIVDIQGDVYVSDCNQLFAFHPDGASKWTIALPPLQKGDWIVDAKHPVNAFTTAAFTQEGHIFGVTNFGDVVVADRQTGEILNHPYRLPAEIAPYSDKISLPDSLLSDGLIDPAFKEWAWQVIFAGNMRSANTPAVAASGRIFIVGSSNEFSIGALFAIDLVKDQVAGKNQSINVVPAFTTKIGIGSGSSPALSPSEHQVYVSDEDGWLYAINATNGNIVWKVKTAAAAGAAAVGQDGTVYALQEFPAPAIIAVAENGEIAWESDLTPLTKTQQRSWLLGKAIASANGNPTVTNDAILVPVMFGYKIPFTQFSIPYRSAIVAIDLKTGKGIKEVVQLIDDSSGITAVLPNGTIVSSIGSVMTSALTPLKKIANWLLPGDLKLLEPIGGVQISIPAT